jgi:pyruvate dehydrogenase E2 component (dihydrolipoamide acetyltransferase)
VLPNLGFGMEEGRLLTWRKQPGDRVRKGEVLADVESDKATVELEAVADGILAEVLVPADTVASVGAVLARIDTAALTDTPAPAASAPLTSPSASQRVTPLARRMADAHGVDLSAVAGTGAGGRISSRDVQGMVQGVQPGAQADQPPSTNGARAAGRPLAAPAVRKLARDNGLDLHTIVGTGKSGIITRADVTTALRRAAVPATVPVTVPAVPATAPVTVPVTAPAVPPALSSPATPVPAAAPAPISEGRSEVHLSRMRQVIAGRLAQSMQQSPHYYVTAELDFTPALRHLPTDIGINALLMYLTVQTLRAVPDLNATYEDGRLYRHAHINLAVAIALPDGLITPVLHRADDYSLRGLADRARELVNRTRESRLKPDELSGGTFTVSNLGVVQQVDRFTAIINPPQVAILAIGAVKKRPFVIDEGLFVRTTAHLTLSSDHRFIDGMMAARYLEAFDKHLQAFTGN